jgi:hypothetical protein
LKGVSVKTKNLNDDNSSLERNLNPRLSGYEAGVLLTLMAATFCKKCCNSRNDLIYKFDEGAVLLVFRRASHCWLKITLE